MIKCSYDEALLRRLIENKATPAEERKVVAHLDTCAACQRVLESLAADPACWRELPDYFKSTSLVDSVADDSDATSIQRERSLVHSVVRLLKPTTTEGSLGCFGPYEIERVVGEGSSGMVLKGKDTSLDRVVAIKVLSPHYAGSPLARRRFDREARSAAAVVHPHVVPIHAVGIEADLPYLVMSFVAGKSLQDRISAAAPMHHAEIARVAMQIADGLAAAHAQGLVHRDIKPANILLENGVERVVLSDFGLARAVDDVSITRSGLLAGTPEYMSPEQARGEPIDHRSDLFSLGCVMYAMATGHGPFRGDSTVAVLKLICESEPREIRSENPELPEWLAAVVKKLLHKDPERRFQQASEVAKLLKLYLAHLEDAATVDLPTIVAEPNRPMRRLRPAWGIAMVLLLSGLLGLVAFWSPSLLLPTAGDNQSDKSVNSQSLPKVYPRATTKKGHNGKVYHTFRTGSSGLQSPVRISVFEAVPHQDANATPGPSHPQLIQSQPRRVVSARTVEPSRRLANAILSQNGTVNVRLKEEGRDVRVDLIAYLPAGPIELTGISLGTSSGIYVHSANRQPYPGTVLDFVGSCSTLEQVSLQLVNVTDKRLTAFASLPRLRKLTLARCNILGGGLRHLRGLRQLEALSLNHNQISDDSLKHLQSLPKLWYLSLVDTAVSDAGVPTLAAIKSLRYLDLRSTKVTSAGASQLRKALPACEVRLY